MNNITKEFNIHCFKGFGPTTHKRLEESTIQIAKPRSNCFESGGRVVVLMQKLATLRSKRTGAEIGPFIVKKKPLQ